MNVLTRSFDAARTGDGRVDVYTLVHRRGRPMPRRVDTFGQ